MPSTPYSHFVPASPINPSYEEGKQYVLIESLQQLADSFIPGKAIAWDTETTGLNPAKSSIVGFSYTYDGITGYYCPVHHFDLALGKPALDLFYTALKSAPGSFLYNARFDIRIMEYSGYDMSFLYPKDPATHSSHPKFIDVMNSVWLADTNIPLPSLKSSTLHFLGFQPPKFMETLGTEQNFQYVPARQAYRYACFTEDTLIQAKQGLLPISEIKVGTLIKTSLGYSPVTSILDQGMRPVIKVTPPYGSPFTVTPDHQFAFLINGTPHWVQAQYLDKIPFSNRYSGGASLNNIPSSVPSDTAFIKETCTIEPYGQAHVYDLSILSEHNFFLQCGLIAHNCLDAINTYNLARVTHQYHKESGLAAQMDTACIYIIGQLEKTPLNIDTQYLTDLRDDVYSHTLQLEREIYSIAGRNFKIGSSRELTSVFLEQGIDTGERTKAGDMKTGIEQLSAYLRNHPDCTLLTKLIEYKKQFKFYNSYLKTLVEIAEKQHSNPPRFSYKLQAVPTGRLACLEGSTIIPTVLGNIPISELSMYEEGNEVYIDPSQTAPFSTLYMGVRECVEIHLSNKDKIIATLDHRFLNTRTVWVQVEDINIGDTLLSVIQGHLSQTTVTNIIPIKDPQPVYTLAVYHPYHQYISNTLISHNCGKDGKNDYFSPINLQCLEENTEIKTLRGNIPIKNIIDGDQVWTGNQYTPCKQLGSKKKAVYRVKTLWGSIESSLEHSFLTINQKKWEIEWHTLDECLHFHYPIVRDPESTGTQFDELYTFYLNDNLSEKYPNKYRIYESKKLTLYEYKILLFKYSPYKFDIIIEDPKDYLNPSIPPTIKTVYDLYVPVSNQFTANGYIVHNSLPKPKSVKCYGRKATQEEIDAKQDTLGWIFSPDHPEWSPGKIVEGMSQKLNVRSAFLPKHPENGDYVVSIDMCFEAGSPVQTKRGYMGISEMKVGDYIYSPQGWVEVIRIMQTGVRKLIKVYPDNGGQALYCTEDHPFIIDGNIVQAKDIKGPVPSVPFRAWVQDKKDLEIIASLLSPLRFIIHKKDRIAYIKKHNLENVIVESVKKYTRAKILYMCGMSKTEISFLKVFTQLPPVHVRPKNDKVWNNIFCGVSTPTNAYILGYILGDGNISWKRSDYPVLNITSKDYPHLVQISNTLGDGLILREHKKGNNTWWSLDIPSRDLCSRLKDLGISERKSTEPSYIDFDWLGDNFRHFIRGLFDSDGYVRLTSSLDFSFVGHNSYMEAIYKLLPGSWVYRYTESLSYISLRGTLDQKKFIYSFLYEGATIWLQRKRDILDSWYISKFGDIILPVWNCTVNTPEHLIYVQGMNVHQCGEELRIVTDLAHEDNWARVINAGEDLHHANAVALFGADKYTKEIRKRAKACISGEAFLNTPKGRIKIKDLSPSRSIGTPVPISEYIFTPEGYKKAIFFIYNGYKPTRIFHFSDGTSLEVTHDHIVKSNSRQVEAITLKVGDKIDSIRTLRKEIINIEESESDVFDITVDNRSHLFYANGCVVHNCAFGMLYGQEYRGFQRKFPEMTLDEAQEFMIKFKKNIPHITRWQERMVKDAKRTGTFYTGFGRPRRVKHYFTSPDYRDIAFGKRTVLNGPVQGTAADILKVEFVRLWDNLFTVYPEIDFICTIHDEINYSVPRNLAYKVIPIMIKCMTITRKDWPVTLDCSLSVGPTLGNIYPMKYNFTTKEFEPDWEEDTATHEPAKEEAVELEEEIDEEMMDMEPQESTSEIKEEKLEAIDSHMFVF